MTMILFPSQPFDLRAIDTDFEDERTTCRSLGMDSALVDHTRVLRGDIDAAVAAVPQDTGLAVYRGWMLRSAQYAELFAALSARGVTLVNDTAAYRFCHELPGAYPTLEGATPRSVWLQLTDGVDFARVHEMLRPFGSSPLIVKDFVKSQKHYWSEACFIPDASDRTRVEAVTRRFLELQAEELNEGLVFREFVPLKRLGNHPKSGMPLGAEVRTFWLDGELLLSHDYWSELPMASPPEVPLAWLANIARRIPSRFFTIDIALRSDDTWIVMELGDGQVTGLPTAELHEPFYKGIRDGLKETKQREGA